MMIQYPKKGRSGGRTKINFDPGKYLFFVNLSLSSLKFFYGFENSSFKFFVCS
jgi:hypothetical protein